MIVFPLFCWWMIVLKSISCKRRRCGCNVRLMRSHHCVECTRSSYASFQFFLWCGFIFVSKRFSPSRVVPKSHSSKPHMPSNCKNTYIYVFFLALIWNKLELNLICCLNKTISMLFHVSFEILYSLSSNSLLLLGSAMMTEALQVCFCFVSCRTLKNNQPTNQIKSNKGESVEWCDGAVRRRSRSSQSSSRCVITYQNRFCFYVWFFCLFVVMKRSLMERYSDWCVKCNRLKGMTDKNESNIPFAVLKKLRLKVCKSYRRCESSAARTRCTRRMSFRFRFIGFF